LAVSSIVARQRKLAFSQEIVNCENQSDAYRKSHPNSNNWKDTTVHKRASELMKDGEVMGMIEELKKAAAESSEVTAAKVISQLVAFGFYDIRLLHDKDSNKPMFPWELPEEIIPAVAGVTYNTDGSVKEYKMVSKDKAIELLGRYFNMFRERLGESPDELGDTKTDPVELARSLLFLFANADKAMQTTH
jgi:hypothetical protein